MNIPSTSCLPHQTELPWNLDVCYLQQTIHKNYIIIKYSIYSTNVPNNIITLQSEAKAITILFLFSYLYGFTDINNDTFSSCTFSMLQPCTGNVINSRIVLWHDACNPTKISETFYPAGFNKKVWICNGHACIHIHTHLHVNN